MDYTEDMKSFLAWEAVSRSTIDVKMAYIDLAQGDHAAGILLSQIIYWYMLPSQSGGSKLRVRRDGYYWIAKGRHDWWPETRLTARQFDRASKILEKAGLIEKSTYKFAGVPQMHVRLLQDNFLAAWHALVAEIDVDEEGGVKSTLPIGEVHIQRLHKDQDFTDKSVKSTMSKQGNGEKTERGEGMRHKCPSCDRSDALSSPVKIDPRGRCAWCFVCDGWEKYMQVRVPTKLRRDENGRVFFTKQAAKLRKKAAERFESDEFSDNFVFMLQRAAKTRALVDAGWFKVEFILRDDEKWRDVVNGWLDWKNEESYPDSHRQLQAWLARRQAGLPAAGAGPQTLGQMGG